MSTGAPCSRPTALLSLQLPLRSCDSGLAEAAAVTPGSWSHAALVSAKLHKAFLVSCALSLPFCSNTDLVIMPIWQVRNPKACPGHILVTLSPPRGGLRVASGQPAWGRWEFDLWGGRWAVGQRIPLAELEQTQPWPQPRHQHVAGCPLACPSGQSAHWPSCGSPGAGQAGCPRVPPTGCAPLRDPCLQVPGGFV